MKTWVGIVVVSVLLGTGYAESAVVFVHPETSYVQVGDTLEVTVEVDSSALELKGFDVVLSFDAVLLNVLSVTQGSLMKQGGATFWDCGIDSNTVEIVCAILGTGLSVDGPGVLATMSFKIFGAGQTDLVFEEIDLRNVDNQPIPSQPRDGVVCIATHVRDEDVSIADMNPLNIQLDIFPNPCKRETCIQYEIPCNGTVKLLVHDCAGRVIRCLADEPKCAGVETIVWDTRNDGGYEIPSGSYFGTLQFHTASRGKSRVIKKIIVVE